MKQQCYAQVRRQLGKVQLTKPHMATDGDWYSFDEDDHNWWETEDMSPSPLPFRS
ncbi:NACHT, LRR and PYD domains-containing protein 5 [Cricetulus griseus]|uniref:NACHT, LRR and PYD domains-containing protein 5 n=1 Tax=Cricetulus griseus TaxID=10029 RepID=G3GUH1_CRIGR|nr:NACHT, LRR and PYD domains-containing protein 5 [Cricetulus griseus]